MRQVALLALLLLATACQKPVTHEQRQTLFGIEHYVQIVDPDPEHARRAIEAVFFEFSLMTKNTQPHISGAMLRTNSLLRSREWFSVNPSLVTQLEAAARFERLSGGWYNPAALGGLRQLWGFYQPDGSARLPSDKEIHDAVAQRPSMADVEFSNIRVRSNNPHVRIDFDQLILGYAIDLQVEHLKELGIQNARLRIGDVERVIGQAETGPWQSTLGFGAPKRRVSLSSGEATCQRSTRDRVLPHAAGVHDVIDPHTGRPIDHTRTAQVIADTATQAVVACWSVLVAGPERWQQVATGLGVRQAARQAADGAWQLTPAMATRLDTPVATPYPSPGEDRQSVK